MDVLGLVLQPNFTGNEHHWRWEIHHDSYEWRTAIHFFTPQCCFWRQHVWVWVVSVKWHEASHQLRDCHQCRFSAGIWKTWRRLAQCRTEHDRFTVHAVEPTRSICKIVPVWTVSKPFLMPEVLWYLIAHVYFLFFDRGHESMRASKLPRRTKLRTIKHLKNTVGHFFGVRPSWWIGCFMNLKLAKPFAKAHCCITPRHILCMKLPSSRRLGVAAKRCGCWMVLMFFPFLVS